MKRLALLVSIAAAVFAAAVVAQAADVTVGHSGWNWGNPQPQGNTLRAVDFAGSRGYAAGDFGTLLRTDDGGRSWTGIPTGITADLARIRAVNQDTVVIGSGCVLRRSDDGGTTFKRLPFTSSETGCPAAISSLYFATPQTGYLLLSDGTVVQTANGGSSFSGRQAVPGTEATRPANPPATPTDILFTDVDTGFAITKGPGGGDVYKTDDGGNTWFPKAHVGQGLNGLYFPDPGVGYAVGNANTVLKTTDGGETWNPQSVQPDVPTNDLTAIRCTTTLSCLISTAGGERVLRTTDGGTTITAFNPSTRKIFAVAFASPTSAVGVGERGATVLSTNADTASPSFVPVGDQPIAGTFDRIRATSSSLVYAPGDNGKLARSIDGGHHWGTVQVPTSEDLLDAWFVDANHGFALDVGGRAQRTEDAGSTWALLDTGTTDRPSAIYAPDDTTVLLFGPTGVRRSVDAGSTFQAVGSKAARTATQSDYDRTDGTALYAYGPDTLIMSSDLGATWKKVKSPVKKPRYRKVEFVSAQVGFALMGDGRVFRTTNGGKKWTDLPGTGSSTASDVSFGDTAIGFLSVACFGGAMSVGTGQNGFVLRTSDGGATWRPQLVEPSPLAARGLATPDASTAFALGGASDLFYTGTGGDLGAGTMLTIAAGRNVVTKTRRVKITGRLSPAVPGATVAVMTRDVKTGR
ncbi:MAG: hypothetical protein QOC95_1118, partial [Thermoleophilaceae bacterium]|nr:hypothetical protein [Thermoleophilaceae bacterium]